MTIVKLVTHVDRTAGSLKGSVFNAKGPVSILDLISVTGVLVFCSVWMAAMVPYAAAL